MRRARAEVSPITVMIAEPRGARVASCRSLLRRRRGIRVVGEAWRGAEVVAAATALKPRVLLLDAGVSAGDVVPLLRGIRRGSHGTRVIVLMPRRSEDAALDLLAVGARGYLERRVVEARLVKAVRAVSAGESWVPRRLVPRIIRRLRLAEAASA
jgi:DNA-binding NarL/FixJ family response regulator